MVEVRRLDIDGVLEIQPARYADDRGFFSEVWNRDDWRNAGIDLDFVQDNHSFSQAKGVLRGLHYQLPPFAQDKLVRVTCGSVFDVVVDVRRSSPTFGRWTGVELSRDRWNQLLVPKGFAHGFLTLEPDCEVQYKVTAPYSHVHERSIRFDDPAIAIDWPRLGVELKFSDKDAAAPLLADSETFE
jgi:dTDP-4-dehydrorhamnose 3,5-epimerase